MNFDEKPKKLDLSKYEEILRESQQVKEYPAGDDLDGRRAFSKLQLRIGDAVSKLPGRDPLNMLTNRLDAEIIRFKKRGYALLESGGDKREANRLIEFAGVLNKNFHKKADMREALQEEKKRLHKLEMKFMYPDAKDSELPVLGDPLGVGLTRVSKGGPV